MKYKGIIFDFNGVLLWDGLITKIVWDKMSYELRGKPFTKDEVILHIHGRINKDTFEFLVGHSLSNKEVLALEEKKENIYMDVASANLKEYQLSEGVEQLLDFLKYAKIPFTIATASPKIAIDFYEKQLHLSHWFDLSKIVYNDYTFPGKPAPDIYQKAAVVLGLDPKDCIVIEDAVSGIASAHAAGIGYIIAIGPKETHKDLRKLSGVNEVITTISEVDKERLFY